MSGLLKGRSARRERWEGATLAWLALWVCLAPGALAEPPSPRRPVPVIIDTDVGDDIDDAFALAVGLSDPRLEVIGVTTAWGDTRTRVRLVRRLLAAMGRGEVTVAQGVRTADTVPFTQRRWAEGAADAGPAPDAVDFIRAQVARRPGQITLVALAPLSNVRALMARDPVAFRQLRQVVMMGGSIAVGYDHAGAIPNRTPIAEYNVAATPAALADLLASGVPVTLFPLDSTQVKFEEVERDRLFAHGAGASDALALLYYQWRLLNGWGQITPTLFDVVPVAWMIDPAICSPTPSRIVVDAQGFTRRAAGPPNAAVCLTTQADAVRRRVLDDLAPEPDTGKVP